MAQKNVSHRFNSWSEGELETSLDLNEFIIEHPAATFFMRIKGDAFKDSGITDGALIVIDRALSLADNKLIVARLDGELTVRRIRMQGNSLLLLTDDPERTIVLTSELEFEVWGVITYVINKL